MMEDFDEPITSIHDPRVPKWATPRDLGKYSRPPVASEDGIIDDWWIQLKDIPKPATPDWFPPHGMPVQAGETTEPESQSSSAVTEGAVTEDPCASGVSADSAFQ
jgi:hypothetical protein